VPDQLLSSLQDEHDWVVAPWASGNGAALSHSVNAFFLNLSLAAPQVSIWIVKPERRFAVGRVVQQLHFSDPIDHEVTELAAVRAAVFDLENAHVHC
jgi:hypothetical protein